jgi:hypothetical protein
MKQLMIALTMVLVSVVSAQAQMDSSMHCAHEAQHSGQGMMMEPCQQMPMMQHIMKNKMMMQEMMGMMKDTLKIQQKLLEGVKSAEKKEMEKELSQMMDKVDVMMSEMNNMMKPGMKCKGACEACKKMEQKNESPATEESPQPEQLKN